jgi:hypothetical protein
MDHFLCTTETAFCRFWHHMNFARWNLALAWQVTSVFWSCPLPEASQSKHHSATYMITDERTWVTTFWHACRSEICAGVTQDMDMDCRVPRGFCSEWLRRDQAIRECAIFIGHGDEPIPVFLLSFIVESRRHLEEPVLGQHPPTSSSTLHSKGTLLSSSWLPARAATSFCCFWMSSKPNCFMKNGRFLESRSGIHQTRAARSLGPWGFNSGFVGNFERGELTSRQLGTFGWWQGTGEIKRTEFLHEISSSRQSGHVNLIQFDLQWKFRNVCGMRWRLISHMGRSSIWPDWSMWSGSPLGWRRNSIFLHANGLHSNLISIREIAHDDSFPVAQ